MLVHPSYIINLMGTWVAKILQTPQVELIITAQHIDLDIYPLIFLFLAYLYFSISEKTTLFDCPQKTHESLTEK